MFHICGCVGKFHQWWNLYHRHGNSKFHDVWRWNAWLRTAERTIPNRVGDKTQPCFMPRFSSKWDERSPLNGIRASISSCNDLKILRSLGGEPIVRKTMHSSLPAKWNALVESTKAMCSGRSRSWHYWIWRSEVMSVTDSYSGNHTAIQGRTSPHEFGCGIARPWQRRSQYNIQKRDASASIIWCAGWLTKRMDPMKHVAVCSCSTYEVKRSRRSNCQCKILLLATTTNGSIFLYSANVVRYKYFFELQTGHRFPYLIQTRLSFWLCFVLLWSD